MSRASCVHDIHDYPDYAFGRLLRRTGTPDMPLPSSQDLFSAAQSLPFPSARHFFSYKHSQYFNLRSLGNIWVTHIEEAPKLADDLNALRYNIAICEAKEAIALIDD
jgi:hypothetical protein